MNKIKLAVFDLDGTLNQTELYSVPAQRQAILEFGGKLLSDDEIKSHFGAVPDDYVKIYLPNLPKERWQDYFNRAAQLENELMQLYARTFDGVKPTLDELHYLGFQTAVCSNASTRYIELVLNTLGIYNDIDHIQPLIKGMTKAGTLEKLLAHVSPSFAVMIGDRIFDIEAARYNHIPAIGCLYGYAPEEMAEADITVTRVKEIIPSVLKLMR